MCALREDPCSVPGAPGAHLQSLFHARHPQGMTLQEVTFGPGAPGDGVNNPGYSVGSEREIDLAGA